jgi:hypothetical protein
MEVNLETGSPSPSSSPGSSPDSVVVALARVLGVLAATCWCADQKLISPGITAAVFVSISFPAAASAVLALVSSLKGGRDGK